LNSFGLEEVSLTMLLELAELKPNADNLVNLVYDGDAKSSICVNSQIVNSFTTGCDIMKKESVTKHESRKGKLLHIIYNVVSIPCFHSPFQNYNLAQHSR
jgi:hypothetical protein